MNYVHLCLLGLLMMCSSAPIFFISSTDNQGHFKVYPISIVLACVCSIGLVIAITSYHLQRWKDIEKPIRKEDKQ